MYKKQGETLDFENERKRNASISSYNKFLRDQHDIDILICDMGIESVKTGNCQLSKSGRSHILFQLNVKHIADKPPSALAET